MILKRCFLRKDFMNSEGLSAQKNVQWCTFFCAYGGKCKGSEVRDQRSDIRYQRSGIRGQVVRDQRSEVGCPQLNSPWLNK